MKVLRSDTACHIMFGPFVDKTNGVDLEVAAGIITSIDHVTTGIFLSKNGAAGAIRHQGVTASVLDAYGMFQVHLDETDTNTAGNLRVMMAEAVTFLPVHDDYLVIPHELYDTLFVTQPAAAINKFFDKASPTGTVNSFPDAVAGATNGLFIAGTNAATTITTSLTTTFTGNLTGTVAKSPATIAAGDIANNAITAAAIADGAIDNATFAADVGSTAAATNIISQAVELVIKENNLDHLLKTAVSNRDTLPEIVDDTILANLLTKTDGDTSDFNHATDSLEAIRDAIVASNPSTHAATANTETTGELHSGTYADTATNDGTAYVVHPADPAVGGFGLNCALTFNIGTGRAPSTCIVDGHFHAAALRTVQVWAYNYYTAAYVQLSNSTNDFGTSTTDDQFVYSLNTQMVKVDGEVSIRFTSTSITATDEWQCDYCVVNSVAQEAAGLTADAIQKAVWYRADSGHDESTLGYNLAHIFLRKGHPVAATSASQFTIDVGSTLNDSYNGMLIMLEDKTDDHYEVRRIVDYIGGTKEVFLDTALSFTPAAEDDIYILSGGYANVNVTHISGTAQAAGDVVTQATEANAHGHAIDLQTAQLAFTVANKVDANVKTVNDLAIDGAGTALDPWGPS